jgi:hypothetical protein
MWCGVIMVKTTISACGVVSLWSKQQSVHVVWCYYGQNNNQCMWCGVIMVKTTINNHVFGLPEIVTLEPQCSVSDTIC